MKNESSDKEQLHGVYSNYSSDRGGAFGSMTSSRWRKDVSILDSPPLITIFPQGGREMKQVIKSSCMEYRKNSKNWDTLNYYRDCPTNGIVGFYSAILRSKDADRITNRVDTDQTAP